MSAGSNQETTYGVFVSGLRLSADEFAANLQYEGMSAERARQVVESIPCFVKKDVPLPVAEKFKLAFEKAGAWVVLENWQETQNPAADKPNEDEVHAGSPIDLPPLSLDDDALRARRPTPSARLSAPLGDDGLMDLPLPDPAELPPLSPAPSARDAHAAPPPGVHFEVRDLKHATVEQSLDTYAVAKPPARVSEPQVQAWKPIEIVREPWLKRNYLSLILGGIAMMIGLYCYGCYDVMATESCMKKKMSQLSVVLGNKNARRQKVSAGDVTYEAQVLAHKCGVKVSEEQVVVEADSLMVVRSPQGTCHMTNVPDTFQLLPHYEKEEILRGAQDCMLPNWIVRVEMKGDLRWGIASGDYHVVRAVPLWAFDTGEEEE